MENVDLQSQIAKLLQDFTQLVCPKDDGMIRAITSLPLGIGGDGLTKLCSEVVEAARDRLDPEKQENRMREKLREYEEQLLAQEAVMAKSEGNTKVLNELKKMFRDGKELLRLNQQLQDSELFQLEKAKKEVLAEREDLDSYRKHFLLSVSATAAAAPNETDGESLDSDTTPVPFDVGTGPVWSWANASCTLPFAGGVSSTGYGITIGPKPPQVGSSSGGTSSRPPSRPHSRPGSRSHSQVRDGSGMLGKGRVSPSVHNASSGIVPMRNAGSSVARRQRPRSTNISPQRRISLGRLAVVSPLAVGGGGLRSGSSSPATTPGTTGMKV